MNSHRSVTAAITSIPDHSPADNETTDSENLDAEKTSNESITAEENIAEADEETHPAVSFEDSLTVYTGSLSSDITDMNAVAEAVEGTVDSKTRGFQAVDISFRDKDGNEIEPLKPISVTMRSDSIKAATEDSSMAPLVVHVEDWDGETAGTGDSPAATVIETLPDMAENNEGSEVGDSMTGN